MDTRDNKYKKIVNSMVENKDLEKMIGLYIEENIEKESKVDFHKLRRVRIRKSIIISIFITILLTAVALIIISSLYPMTPIGVVRQYIYELENNEIEKAEQYVNSDYEITHDFIDNEAFSFKLVYNDHRHPEDRRKSTVNVWIEYLDEEVDEYWFWLEKSDGKWHIIARGEGKSSLAMGIQRYEPNKDEPQDLHVDFFYTYTNEELVGQADVIAKIKVEDITHIMITSMDKSIVNQRSMYGNFKVVDIYYTNNKQLKKSDLLDIWVNYDPAFANIAAPGIESEGEYIVFLKKLDKDYPKAWEFFDYVLISDFNKYKMDATDENEVLISDLVNKLK